MYNYGSPHWFHNTNKYQSYIFHAISSNVPNKISFPVFSTTIPYQEFFWATVSPFPVSPQSLATSYNSLSSNTPADITKF